jgi:hypothetical protein
MATAIGVFLLLLVSWMFSELMIDKVLNDLVFLSLDEVRAVFWLHFAWVSLSVLALFNEPRPGQPLWWARWHPRCLSASWRLIGVSVLLAIGVAIADTVLRETVQHPVRVIGSVPGLVQVTADNLDQDQVNTRTRHLLLSDLETGELLPVHNREPLEPGLALLHNGGRRGDCVARVTLREGILGVGTLMEVTYVPAEALSPKAREAAGLPAPSASSALSTFSLPARFRRHHRAKAPCDRS